MYSYAPHTQLFLKQLRVNFEVFQYENADLSKDHSCINPSYPLELYLIYPTVGTQSSYYISEVTIQLFSIQTPAGPLLISVDQSGN